MTAGLTVKTAVPGILCHAAAHGLVPLSDVTRSPVQTVVVANPLLAERPGETHVTAACGLTWMSTNTQSENKELDKRTMKRRNSNNCLCSQILCGSHSCQSQLRVVMETPRWPGQVQCSRSSQIYPSFLDTNSCVGQGEHRLAPVQNSKVPPPLELYSPGPSQGTQISPGQTQEAYKCALGRPGSLTGQACLEYL